MAQSLTIGSGGNKTNTSLILGSSGNRKVTEGWIGNSGNKQFYTGLSATAPASATSAVDGLRAPISGNITVTPSDGAGGNIIQWTKTGGDAEVSIDNATSFATFWTASSNPTGRSATYSYSVQDAHGIIASGSVSVIFPSSA